MDVRATRRGVPAGILWCALGITAWAAFTVLTGGGAAHADEQDDGLLAPVTSLVGDTLSSAAAPVAPVVTQVVEPVVQTVVAPVQQAAPVVVAPVAAPVVEAVTQAPVVGTVATPVVPAVAETVESAAAPVTEVLVNAPVTQITQPVADAVAGVPVVGALLEDLGVTPVLGTVIGVVDDAVEVIGAVGGETVPPVIDAVVPGVPVTGVPPVLGLDIPALPGAAGPDVAVLGNASSGTTLLPAFLGMPQATAPASVLLDSLPALSGVSSALDPEGGREATPPGGVPAAPAPSSSASSGGSSPSSQARLADASVPPVSSWDHIFAASDDELPPSPSGSTDVSPD